MKTLTKSKKKYISKDKTIIKTKTINSEISSQCCTSLLLSILKSSISTNNKYVKIKAYYSI